MGYEKTNVISEETGVSADIVDMDNNFKECMANLAGPLIQTSTPINHFQLEKYQQNLHGQYGVFRVTAGIFAKDDFHASVRQFFSQFGKDLEIRSEIRNDTTIGYALIDLKCAYLPKMATPQNQLFIIILVPAYNLKLI